MSDNANSANTPTNSGEAISTIHEEQFSKGRLIAITIVTVLLCVGAYFLNKLI